MQRTSMENHAAVRLRELESGKRLADIYTLAQNKFFYLVGSQPWQQWGENTINLTSFYAAAANGQPQQINETFKLGTVFYYMMEHLDTAVGPLIRLHESNKDPLDFRWDDFKINFTPQNNAQRPQNERVLFETYNKAIEDANVRNNQAGAKARAQAGLGTYAARVIVSPQNLLLGSLLGGHPHH